MTAATTPCAAMLDVGLRNAGKQPPQRLCRDCLAERRDGDREGRSCPALPQSAFDYCAGTTLSSRGIAPDQLQKVGTRFLQKADHIEEQEPINLIEATASDNHHDRPHKSPFASRLFRDGLPWLRPNQARGSPRLVFTISQGNEGCSACRRGIVGDSKQETCFFLGRGPVRAKVGQRRKIVNTKKQSPAGAPDLLPISQSFY
jgi:hypothetical protein